MADWQAEYDKALRAFDGDKAMAKRWADQRAGAKPAAVATPAGRTVAPVKAAVPAKPAAPAKQAPKPAPAPAPDILRAAAVPVISVDEADTGGPRVADLGDMHEQALREHNAKLAGLASDVGSAIGEGASWLGNKAVSAVRAATPDWYRDLQAQGAERAREADARFNDAMAKKPDVVSYDDKRRGELATMQDPTDILRKAAAPRPETLTPATPKPVVTPPALTPSSGKLPAAPNKRATIRTNAAKLGLSTADIDAASDDEIGALYDDPDVQSDLGL